MKQALSVTARILTFRFDKADLQFGLSTFIFGLVCTWLAGIGRYWDHPDPHLLQHLGLGSVLYVFALSFLLWLVLLPLRFSDLRFPHLLTLITLTAPPAILYAIPVERFLPMDTAQSTNAWFLAIVAIWRVSIYFRYLRVYLKAPVFTVIVAGLLPLCGIVLSLTMLNLEKAVFEIMAGLEPKAETSNDAAYMVVLLLSLLSICIGPFLLLFYLGLIIQRPRA